MKKVFKFLILSIVEIVITGFVLYLSYYIRFLGAIPENHLTAFYTVVILFSFSFWFFMLIFGVYISDRLLDIHIFRKILISGIFHLVISFVIILFYNMYSTENILLSRWVFIIYLFLLIFCILIFRTFAGSLADLLMKSTQSLPGLLIYTHQVFDKAESKKLKGFFKDRYVLKLAGIDSCFGIDSVLRNEEHLLNIIERYKIKTILFLKPVDLKEIISAINNTPGLDLNFWLDPEHINLVSNGYKLLPVEGFPFFEIITHPIYGINAFIKRLFDIFISLILIVFSFPLFLIIPILVKIDSKGSTLFKQIRLGLNGTPFKILKFRSMFEDAEEETGPKWADKDDARITRIGKFLRRFSFDELPQLFLVLLGKLSMIGPRPERPYFVEQRPAYKGIRLLVKPGLTGLAQINGRYDLSLEERLSFDLFYINNYSIWLDIEIFFKTIFIILFQKGAR